MNDGTASRDNPAYPKDDMASHNADSGGHGVDPVFKNKVDNLLAPIEELIESMWERLDEIAARKERQ